MYMTDFWEKIRDVSNALFFKCITLFPYFFGGETTKCRNTDIS